MSIVKIKVIISNTVMEIEGPEDFLMKFLNSKCMSMSEPAKAKSRKTGKKKANVVKGAKSADVLETIRLGKADGVTINEVVEATKLHKSQLGPIFRALKKKGLIKSIDKGIYVYAKPKKENTTATAAASATEEQATPAS